MTTDNRNDKELQPPIASATSSGDFWQEKTLAELAAEQGIRPVNHFEEVFGQGAGLWANDEELEAFLANIRAARAGREE